MDDLNASKIDHKQVITVLENCTLSSNLRHKNTVVKYTKLPHFDSKASCCHHNYSLHPRLRRIVTLEDQPIETTRSLKQCLHTPVNMNSARYPKRKIKIITIEDDADTNYFTKSKDVKKTATKTSKAIEANYMDEKSQYSQKTISKVTGSAKILYSKEAIHHITNPKDLCNKIDVNKVNAKDRKQIRISENDKKMHFKEKEVSQNSKKCNKTPKVNKNKNVIVSLKPEKEAVTTKKQSFDEMESGMRRNKLNYKLQLKNSQNHHNKIEDANNIFRKNKPIRFIHVPLEKKPQRLGEKENTVQKIDCHTEIDNSLISKDVGVGTEPQLKQMHKNTEVDINLDILSDKVDGSYVETHTMNEKFQSLNIPKVTLKKETKDLTRKKVINFYSASLPNLKTPSIVETSVSSDHCKSDSRLHSSSSYIIGSATVTYTRKQKIDFHVLEKNQEIATDLCTTSLAYPLNVVSIFKNEINNRSSRVKNIKESEKSESDFIRVNDQTDVNCPHGSGNNKLMKPSDIIGTIRLNNSLLNSDSICAQFQRELNFIDSFFESLQYLEKLSEGCLTDVDFDSLTYVKPFEVNNSDYVTNFTKIENGFNVDDTETMATESLCQLNLLIHNEQRRARDFLFVLKMQEDVLKDYIKSQMLWLEKKKKQDNTDISALRKKQRGALLKLQHECGEMQRMRKALLTLSEKRKVALMRTKKNIEMKLKNNVNVDHILLGKKKLKRNPSSDRSLTPVKCFELSSSGCEDSTAPRQKSDCTWYSTFVTDSSLNVGEKSVTSAEKSIQTGDSILAADAGSQSAAAAAENCIVVDGDYLNILFHNLSLPQIFSAGKQYEVNEEALKNIVNSSNSRNNVSQDSDEIEKFIGQVKNHESESSSSASTAHSLVEEFDQYYKCLEDEDKSLTNSPDSELKEYAMQSDPQPERDCCDQIISSISMDNEDSLLKRLKTDRSVYLGPEHSCVCTPSAVSVESQTSGVVGSVAGPLPIPAGEPAVAEDQPSDLSQWSSVIMTSNDSDNSQNDQEFGLNVTPIPTYTSPVLYEAEELRRQQLAIEREIKALEQQQCLLVVREIPDKPPPPYTPPSEPRMPRTARKFLKDALTEDKIHKQFLEHTSDNFETNDPFDGFVKDFCEESIERQRSGTSDKPWDAYNLLPQRPQPDAKKIVEKTCSDLKEVLSGVTPTYVSGVGSRRTDHIDDILFAEWRRCEPEWTSLHTDEALVKNQLFESVFQKILNETLGEYKRIVCNDKGNE